MEFNASEELWTRKIELNQTRTIKSLSFFSFIKTTNFFLNGFLVFR